MFDRYTVAARRAIYWAHSEASEHGSPFIETEHLLLALLREDDGLVRRLLRGGTDVEDIRREIQAATPSQNPVIRARELPLSSSMRLALANAAQDAGAFGHQHIGSDHLLLGIVRDPTSFAARVLQKHGIDRERVLAARKGTDPA